MQRVIAATDKAMQSPVMHRILMDVEDPVTTQKIVDAFIEGAKCGASAMGQEVLASFKGARNEG
jgi:hypothetical protein